jgi:16S rRNA G966 N2-methylase RsmD
LPTAKVIQRNVAALSVEQATDVVFGDAFIWSAKFAPEGVPLAVFCSPPYDFYVSRKDDMLRLIQRWTEISPPGSQMVVEADERFEMAGLPEPEGWDVRQYPPAVVAVHRC